MKKIKLYIIFIVLLCVLGLLSFLTLNFKQESPCANIYKDGELIKTVDLENVKEDYEFTVADELGENVIRVEKGRIRVVSASCPDKVCVNQGYIENGVIPIVCLPNKLVIEIEGAEETDIDAVAK